MKKTITFLFTIFLLQTNFLQAQCNFPLNLRSIAYGPTFIEVDWDNTTAGSFEIRYVAQGGNIGTAPITTTSSKPYRITGLNPSSTYLFQVREVCTGTNPWPSAQTGQTSCNIVNPPFTANFNGAAWTVGTTFQAGTINSCWQRDPTSTGYLWKPGPPAFVSTLTGPSNGVGGSGKFVTIDNLGFTFGQVDSALLISPLFDLGTLTAPRLRFFYHMYGGDIEDLLVYVSNDFGASYQLLQTISGQQQFSNSDAWKESILDLAAYANDTIRIKFVSLEQTVGFQNATSIDDVSVEETPSCPKPQNLSLLSVRANSASFNWTSGGATNWELSYGSPGFAVANGTIISTNSNPSTISGLSANTNYEVYLRDSCGPGDLSSWIGPLAFKTACNPLSAPYTENFDANGFITSNTFNGLGSINSCWTRGTGSYVWKPGPPFFSPTNTGPSSDNTSGSGQYYYIESTAFGGLDSSVTTSPLIDISSLTAPQLTFFTHMFGADIVSLKTYVDGGNGFVLVNTQTGPQQTSKTDSWKEVIIALTNFLNDTIQIKFVGYRNTNGFAADIAIDDIDIDEAPSCPKPQNLALVSIGTNSATISWQSGGATNWNISYGAPGTSAGTGTLVNTSSNPSTISGLSANTNYDVFVRDSCGSGDVSDWIGPISIRTLCNPISAPYFENFDGTDFAPGTFTVAGTYNNCWNRDSSGNYQWSVEDGPSPLFGTGPSGDHTTGNDQYILSQAIFAAGLNQVTSAGAQTPAVDLGNLTVPELRFWYHMFGTGIDSLSVQIDNGSGFTHLSSLTGQQQNASTDAWKEAIISLAAYANDTIRIQFIAYRNTAFTSQAAISIDDLRIDEQPTCPEPTNLTIVNTSANSVTISWTSGGATNWQIEYGAAGFSQGSGTLINANSNPFTITGLNPSTAYDFYVRDSCGIADVSFWTVRASGRTDCTIQTAPYFENFDNASWTDPVLFNDPGDIDPCWNRSDTTAYFWRGNLGASDGFNTGPNGDHTTGNGKYAYSIRQGGFNTNLSTDLVTPIIDLDTLSNPELRFWYHMFGIDINKLEVYINNGGSWSLINTITGQQQTSANAAWAERIVSLNSYVGDSIRLRFRAFRTNGFSFRASIAIDDIRIDNIPTCPEPTNLSSTSSTATSLTLNWTSGGATNWQIKYRPSGSTQPFVLVNASSNPYTLTGLNPSTTYEIFVRDSCGPGDVSWWEGPAFESTNCGIASLPFIENFDNTPWQSGTGFFNTGDQISNCWTRNRNGQNDKWGTRNGATSSFNTGPNSDASGSGNYIYFESNFSSSSNIATMRTPEVALLNVSDVNLYYQYHMFGNDIGTLQIRLNTRNNGNGIILKTWTGQQQTSSAAAWKIDSIDLNNYVGDTVEVIFRVTPINGSFAGTGDIAIDEVAIRSSGPSCGIPTNLQLTNATYNSINFSWNITNTSGSTTNLRWYEASAGPGTATVVNGITSPYSINGLNPTTDYVIELFDSCGTIASSSLIDTLSTLTCDSVSASFTFIKRFLNRRFTSIVSNADTLYWSFGNGDSSNAQDPNYTYPSPGTYTVTLIAANDCGNADTSIQVINVCDTLFANFSWIQTADSTIFNADTSNNAIGYSWDLDDGFSGTGPRSSVKYGDNLEKTVTLTSWNACGDTVRNTRKVKPCDPPIADWTYTILNPINAGLRVQFDGTLSQNAISYDWDFGDGTSGTGPNPIHIYSTPGLFYEVELTVRNNCGGIDTRKFKLNQIGIEESSLSKVTVYPNPFKHEVRINWPEDLPEMELVRLIDSRGAEIKHWSKNQAKDPLRLDDLSPGYYYLIIQSSAGQREFPLIKN